MGKILILGGTGMIGHTLFYYLNEFAGFDVLVSVRSRTGLGRLPKALETNVIEGVDAYNFDRLAQIIGKYKPETIINCVGLTKRLPGAANPVDAIYLNALFPQRLAVLCQMSGIRAIHFSTDCVFSGRKGLYSEADEPDAVDIYGRTKMLGEIRSSNCLTLRSSLIGHELKQKTELLEWAFLQNGRTVPGYLKAIFSGITTLEMAKVLERFILKKNEIEGLFHISSTPISKFCLLEKIAAEYSLDLNIYSVDEPIIDRSLNSSAFNSITGYIPPSWDSMLAELKDFYCLSPLYKGN